MPRKRNTPEPEEEKQEPQRRIPDYADGDGAGPELPLVLTKMSWRRKKGVLGVTLTIDLALNSMPAEAWPSRLEKHASEVYDAMTEDGEVYDVVMRPKADVRAHLTHIEPDHHVPIFVGVDARISKLMLHAEPGSSYLRILLQVEYPQLLDAGLALLRAWGRTVILRTETLQQRLGLKGRSSELPPEPGDPPGAVN